MNSTADMNSTSLDGGAMWLAPSHLAALACALALPLLLFALLCPGSGDLAKVPGPRGLPVLGNLLSVAVPNTHQVFREWADRWERQREREEHPRAHPQLPTPNFPHPLGRHLWPRGEVLYPQSPTSSSPTRRCCSPC